MIPGTAQCQNAVHRFEQRVLRQMRCQLNLLMAFLINWNWQKKFTLGRRNVWAQCLVSSVKNPKTTFAAHLNHCLSLQLALRCMKYTSWMLISPENGERNEFIIYLISQIVIVWYSKWLILQMGLPLLFASLELPVNSTLSDTIQKI